MLNFPSPSATSPANSPKNTTTPPKFGLELTSGVASMARKAIQIDQIVKLIVGAGQASPSPPVGPALGSKGVKSMDFCKACLPQCSSIEES